MALVGAVSNAMDRGLDEASDQDRVIGSTMWISLLFLLQTDEPVR
jgi:hypothetical protein